MIYLPLPLPANIGGFFGGENVKIISDTCVCDGYRETEWGKGYVRFPTDKFKGKTGRICRLIGDMTMTLWIDFDDTEDKALVHINDIEHVS